MRERPIIFSGPMVRAILDGRKRQTRRVMRPQPSDHHWNILPGYKHYLRPIETSEGILWKSQHFYGGIFDGEEWFRCPYGVPGDRLWVKETFAMTEQAGDHAADSYPVYRATDPDWETMEGWRWRPSIYMPRWASRITLEITDVRVERVQSIRDEEVIKEGIRCVTKDGTVEKYCIYDKGDYCSIPWCDMSRVPRDAFQTLWDTINANRGYSWESNPWVWVLEFRRKNEKRMPNDIAGDM